MTTAPTHPVQPELIPQEVPDDAIFDDDDRDSALGDEIASLTGPATASILEYRHIQGRTYHSDRHQTEYFTPNDDQQMDSVDISHHYLTLLLDGQLHLAPIRRNTQRVLDVGTGSGIWAIDFADQHPEAEVIGSDLSPCQPQWVPPNVRFEVDDATLRWSRADDTFDFIHIRYLFGAIKDWPALFSQAFRCCCPGGWVQSCEADIEFWSDDGTTEGHPALQTWKRLYDEGGRVLGQPFFPLRENLQERAFHRAGFKDIQAVEYKIPVGGWPKDKKLAEIGQYVRLTMDNDIEGYTLLLWHHVLDWPKHEYPTFLADMRRCLRNPRIHSYMKVRYVYGRKPDHP